MLPKDPFEAAGTLAAKGADETGLGAAALGAGAAAAGYRRQ